MHEVVRLVADWLADDTGGVAAVLATVPRFAGDAAPTALAAIYDASRHAWVARGQVPRDDNTFLRPCLIVSMPGAMSAQPSVRDTTVTAHHMVGQATVAVQYLRRDADSVEALRDCSYVLRAVRGSLLLLADTAVLTANVTADRQANGVRIMHVTKFETHHGPLAVNDTTVTGLVLATLTTWETTPLS